MHILRENHVLQCRRIPRHKVSKQPNDSTVVTRSTYPGPIAVSHVPNSPNILNCLFHPPVRALEFTLIDDDPAWRNVQRTLWYAPASNRVRLSRYMLKECLAYLKLDRLTCSRSSLLIRVGSHTIPEKCVLEGYTMLNCRVKPSHPPNPFLRGRFPPYTLARNQKKKARGGAHWNSLLDLERRVQ